VTDADSKPALVIVGGVPGAGKSTVAELIADRLGAERLRSDEIRKELFDRPTYAEGETETVYETLRDRAADRLTCRSSPWSLVGTGINRRSGPEHILHGYHW